MRLVKDWRQLTAFFTHPALLEAAWLSYWSRWQVGWILASWGLLVGVSGLFYVWVYQRPRDIALLLGSERRFLLLWNLLAIAGLWAATAEPLLHLWLGFFLWMSFWGFLLHWLGEYSFHVYGWSGMLGFFLLYAGHYPLGVIGLAGTTLAVGYLRYHQGAHTRPEIFRGLSGIALGLLFAVIHELT